MAKAKARYRENMPNKIAENFGVGKLEKGKWNNFNIIAWDFTEECIGEKCPLWNICKYKNQCAPGLKKKHPEIQNLSNKCRMQLRYLKNALTGVILLYGKEGDKSRFADMIRVGYHLLPLYNQLFKFSRMEYAEKELMTLSERGAVRINPLYKEIREIISSLESAWSKIETKALGARRKGKKKEGESDENFLDAMYEVVGANMKSLPLEDKGPEPEELLKKAEAEMQHNEEEGSGMFFEEGIIPDKAPKVQKPKTKAQIKRQAKQHKKAMNKYRQKKRLIRRVRKEEDLKAFNARIRAKNKVITDRKKAQKLAERAKRKANE